MKYLSVFILLFYFIPLKNAFATHNRAGEITYEQLNQYYYKVTITTYTKTSSPADRPELDIFWGDGTGSTLPRNAYQDNFGGAGSDIRKNTYIGYHTYPGPSVYTIYFEDPNRNGGVINIPGSINVPFYIESQLIISVFLGFNNSPVLLQPPIDEGTIGQVFIHNANAYDPDGDSLAYQLIFCKGAGGLAIPGYSYPVASNSFSLDAVTGDLVWDSPVTIGEFNVAFLIKEYRNGVQIGFVERDMQINILPNQNNNTPPAIAPVADLCVTAGDLVNFNVTAIDAINSSIDLVFINDFDNYNGNPVTVLSGWAYSPNNSNSFSNDPLNSGVDAPSYIFSEDSAYIRTPEAPQRMDSVTFFVKGIGAPFSLQNELQLFQSTNAVTWTLVAAFDSLPVNGTYFHVDLNGNTFLKFLYRQQPGGGSLAIDDIIIYKFNLLTLTATGAPLLLPSFPAQFNQPVYGYGTVTGAFDWQTDCSHVRKAPYQMVFKAEDNDTYVELVDLEAVQITVVAPAPQNPTATPIGNAIQLNWDPSICQQALGYRIYRRSGFFGFIPGPCETGVPGYTGYSRIANVNGLATTGFLDNNNGNGLAPGAEYCYMVVAFFGDSALSYASVEFCAALKKDLPVITNASVISTNTASGSMYVAWSKPVDLDSSQFPPPYEYRILRAQGIGGTAFTVAGTTFDLDDTLFTDTGLNTVQNAYTYKIDLYATIGGAMQNVGASQPASSVFLSIAPSDEKLNLSWNFSVPWQNDVYVIYRYNGTAFDSIGFSNTTSFTDTALVNGQSYCYYVMSSGSYAGPGFVNPILNNSQEICATPYDNVPPCALSTDTSSFDCIMREIVLTWNLPDDSCADDVNFYNIYYATNGQGPFSLLATVTDGSLNTYLYTNEISIAGCYYVTAVDTNGNEGAPGTMVCVDNCPFYELPNVFTPDGNNFNDEFQPFPYRYIRDIDLKIYSRWGLKVFETKDPAINWNGKTDNTGEELPEGVYYYTCIVNEIYLSGIKSRELTGVIQLFRDKNNPNK